MQNIHIIWYFSFYCFPPGESQTFLLWLPLGLRLRLLSPSTFFFYDLPLNSNRNTFILTLRQNVKIRDYFILQLWLFYQQTTHFLLNFTAMLIDITVYLLDLPRKNFRNNWFMLFHISMFSWQHYLSCHNQILHCFIVI